MSSPLASGAPVEAAPTNAPRTRRIRNDILLPTAASGLLVLFLVAILGPVLWPLSPDATDLSRALEAPSLSHPMGMDQNGRDVLARFIAGAGVSLFLGLIIALLGALIGGTLGLALGMTTAPWVAVVLRIMDATLAFPPLVLAMAVTVALGSGVWTASIGIVLTSIPFIARLVRSDVLRVRSATFIEAQDTLGSPRPRTVLFHVLPHVFPTLVIQTAANFGYAILTLAALGFLGLGAQIPMSEWGLMITEGQNYALTGQWWLAIYPGIGILIAVTSASMVADRLRTLLDPRRI
ncbi:ABC transporter permease [Microbacterium pseudoresistens]|uniref:Peptide/nickel transport system permease protein n=1 Tax=Microbacterium pseudoresistens TaxID=640634 RepID=A0A7Y9ETK6_9MICO|nr:ABC transporter permease [Microbacterium pseudoresistens]NYD53712.1 peptide/nickel transport system permease protein [Microbacterium pseudoresistens]